MKKFLALLFLVSGMAWGQATPSAWSTNYAIRNYASGANPGADSLNANWNELDSVIYQQANQGLTTASTVGWVGVTTVGPRDTDAGINATNITSPVTTATGLYRVSMYLETTTAGGGSESAKAFLRWEENDGASVDDSTAILSDLSATTENVNKTFFIFHTGAGSVPLQYYVDEVDAAGSGQYILKIAVERLN